MAEPLKKPVVRFLLGDGDDATIRTVKGRDAWLLKTLVDRGERGVTAFDEVGPRLSHYAFKLRRAGLRIETKDEAHGGAFAGHHGRYVLRSPVTIIEGGTL